MHIDTTNGLDAILCANDWDEYITLRYLENRPIQAAAQYPIAHACAQLIDSLASFGYRNFVSAFHWDN